MKYIIGILVVAVIGLMVWHTLPRTSTTKLPNSVRGEDANALQIVTSIYPLAYLTERIVGNTGVVTNIGEGQDPHDFRPSARNIQTMQDADLVVLQGAELEPWGDKLREQLARAKTPVVIATKDLALFEVENIEHDTHEDEHDAHEEEAHRAEHADDHDAHDHGQFDPHTWLDPVLTSQMAEHITQSLLIIDSNNQSVYKKNLAQLQQDLSELDQQYKKSLSSCAVNKVIASHDAFGYLGRRYGFEIHPIGGLSTQDTPSMLTLSRLQEEAKDGITTILLEENSIDAYGQTLARETGLQTLPMSPIVYNIPQGKNYLDVMRSNLNTLTYSLDCNG